jgi:pyruvate/2-oxoglutarate dehydrogenase complex dihydrolipoamide acyltransferase (E2) component
MDVNILMPQLGNEIEEAQVDAWLKKAGDAVTKGEQIVVVTTPKVTFEIEAPEAGTLIAILVESDEIAPVGAILGVIKATGT